MTAKTFAAYGIVFYCSSRVQPKSRPFEENRSYYNAVLQLFLFLWRRRSSSKNLRNNETRSNTQQRFFFAYLFPIPFINDRVNNFHMCSEYFVCVLRIFRVGTRFCRQTFFCMYPCYMYCNNCFKSDKPLSFEQSSMTIFSDSLIYKDFDQLLWQ